MKLPLIVGESPSRTSDPSLPLSGRCGEKLLSLTGLKRREDLLRVADLANVFDSWTGEKPGAAKGFRWPRKEARARVLARADLYEGRPVVVALGKRVAGSLGVVKPANLTTRIVSLGNDDGVRVFTLPHPSGVNRFWNDPTDAKRAALMLRAILEVPRRFPDAAPAVIA